MFHIGKKQQQTFSESCLNYLQNKEHNPRMKDKSTSISLWKGTLHPEPLSLVSSGKRVQITEHTHVIYI